jgi:hypothetical protein
VGARNRKVSKKVKCLKLRLWRNNCKCTFYQSSSFFRSSSLLHHISLSGGIVVVPTPVRPSWDLCSRSYRQRSIDNQDPFKNSLYLLPRTLWVSRSDLFHCHYTRLVLSLIPLSHFTWICSLTIVTSSSIISINKTHCYYFTLRSIHAFSQSALSQNCAWAEFDH